MASKVNTSFTNSKTDIKRMAFRGQCTHAQPGLPNHLKTTFQTDPQVSSADCIFSTRNRHKIHLCISMTLMNFLRNKRMRDNKEVPKNDLYQLRLIR